MVESLMVACIPRLSGRLGSRCLLRFSALGRWLGLLSALMLAGCSGLPTPPDRAQPTPPKTTHTAPTPAKAAQHVVVLYAPNVPTYQTIADALVAHAPARIRAVAVHSPAQARSWLRDAATREQVDQVVAVGAVAARGVDGWYDKPVVFCQVFNYQDYGLTAVNRYGVNILPPPKIQFRAWRQLAPDAKRLGVVTGPGHGALIESARKAARRQGMTLIHRVAQTDKEALYLYKRMVPDIDGIWLLPDDRILSRRVLRGMMQYSARHEKPALVFHPGLLGMGGLMSVSSVEQDIAEQVMMALKQTSNTRRRPGFRLLPLTKAHIEVNHEVARNFGYGVAAPAGDDADVR